MENVSYPNLANLSVQEQRDYWKSSLKQCDALTLEAWINVTAEPDNSPERAKYEKLVRAQRRLRKAHELWLSTLPEEEEETASVDEILTQEEIASEVDPSDSDLDLTLFKKQDTIATSRSG